MLIDEHPLFRQGCRNALEEAGDCTIVAEASESAAGLDLAKLHTPDVVLIDALFPLTMRSSWHDRFAILRHAPPLSC